MRAIVLRKPGAPEHLTLEEVEDPTPAADEVVVRLRAAALNHRANRALKPPKKVCPHCATEAETFAGNCPNCGRSYARTSPWKIAAIATGAVVLILGGCGACGLAAVKLAEAEEHSISRAEFASVGPGTTRSEFEARFGDPFDTYRSGGATCLSYYREGQGFLGFDFYEFCFVRGILASKDVD